MMNNDNTDCDFVNGAQLDYRPIALKKKKVMKLWVRRKIS